VVEDDGPGAAAADLPCLARRFYRGEHSRTTPGNGLGLSLVSAVAELHGAAMRIDALTPGLRVSLSFPPTDHALAASAERSAGRPPSPTP